MVYVIKAKGYTVDMVKSLREAELTYKDCGPDTQMFAVNADGSANLIRRK